jgi:hypothetical protein
MIYLGEKYTRMHPQATGSPFYNDLNWVPFTLYINDRVYEQISARYDILDDQLILKLITSTGELKHIVGNKTEIDSFLVGTELFIRLDHKAPENSFNFYQQVYRGNNLYLLKHHKEYVDTKNAIHPNGLYSRQKTELHIFRYEKLIPVTGKKEFIALFPLQKAKIKDFLKENNSHFNKLSFTQIQLLCMLVDNDNQ